METRSGQVINVRFNLGAFIQPESSDESPRLWWWKPAAEEEAGATLQAGIDKAKDSLSNVAKVRTRPRKRTAKPRPIKTIKNSIRNVANQKLKDATDKATQEVKDKVGEQVGDKVGEKVNEKAGEVFGDQGQKKVEDVKKKLDTWDPLRKKRTELGTCE